RRPWRFRVERQGSGHLSGSAVERARHLRRRHNLVGWLLEAFARKRNAGRKLAALHRLGHVSLHGGRRRGGDRRRVPRSDEVLGAVTEPLRTSSPKTEPLPASLT